MTGEWTTILATYAAIVSTSGLLWNVYSWHKARSVDLRGSATPNVIVMGGAPDPHLQGKQFISISVANHGTMPCYIQSMHILAFDNWLAVRRNRPTFAAISLDDLSASVTGKKLPYELKAGDSYTGLITQTPEVVELSRKKLLYITAHHTLSSVGYRMRVQPIKDQNEDPAEAASREPSV